MKLLKNKNLKIKYNKLCIYLFVIFSLFFSGTSLSEASTIINSNKTFDNITFQVKGIKPIYDNGGDSVSFYMEANASTDIAERLIIADSYLVKDNAVQTGTSMIHFESGRSSSIGLKIEEDSISWSGEGGSFPHILLGGGNLQEGRTFNTIDIFEDGNYKLVINIFIFSSSGVENRSLPYHIEKIEIPFQVVEGGDTSSSNILSVSPCYITVGSSSCSASLAWDTGLDEDNPSTSVVIKANSTPLSYFTLGTYAYQAQYGETIFYAHNNTTLLDELFFVASCDSSGRWDSGYGRCVSLEAPSGEISVSPEVCEVPAGGNSCSVNINWSINNPTYNASSAITTEVEETVATGISGTNTYTLSVGEEYRYFHLYHNGEELNQAGAVATCTTGTTWNGVKCAGPTTGDLTATPASCVISENASTCSASLSWSVANPVPTAFTRVTTDTNIVVGDGLSGTASYGVSYGSRRFYLYHNEVELDQLSVTSSCVTGTTWDGAKCVGEVAVEKKVTLSLVKVNEDNTTTDIPATDGNYLRKVESSFRSFFGLRSSTPVKAGTPVRIEWVATGFNPDTIRCTMPDGSPRYQESGYYAITPNSTTTFEITCEDGTTVGEELEETPPYASSQCVGSPGEAEPGLTPETGVYICVRDQLYNGRWGGTYSSTITGICVIGENMSSCNSGISFAVTGSGTESDGKTNQVIKYGGALGTQTVITTSEASSEASSGGGPVLFNLPYSSSPVSFGLFHGTDRYLLLEDFRTVCIKGTSWDTNQGKCIAY